MLTYSCVAWKLTKYREYVICVVLCRYAVDFCYIVNIYFLPSLFFRLSPSVAHEYVWNVITCVRFFCSYFLRSRKKKTVCMEITERKTCKWIYISDTSSYRYVHRFKPTDRVTSGERATPVFEVNSQAKRAWWRRKTTMKHERCNVVIKIIFGKPIGDNK